MKVISALLLFLYSGAAMAQTTGTCQLVSEEKFSRVWQCAPTPSPRDAE